MTPNLSYPLSEESGLTNRAESLQMVVTLKATWEQWHTEMFAYPQQLASVSGLSVLGKTAGEVIYLFYAILYIVRKSRYGPIPLNSVAKSVGCSCFVICCKPFSFYQETFGFLRECVELLLHRLCTLCVCWPSHEHPVALLAFLLACCYFSVCTQHVSAVCLSHSHPTNPSYFTAPKGICWIVLPSPCPHLSSSFFCFSYS